MAGSSGSVPSLTEVLGVGEEVVVYSSEPLGRPVEVGYPALHCSLSHRVCDPLVDVGVQGVGD